MKATIFSLFALVGALAVSSAADAWTGRSRGFRPPLIVPCGPAHPEACQQPVFNGGGPAIPQEGRGAPGGYGDGQDRGGA